MQYIIRQCTPDDTAGIVALWEDIFRNQSPHNEAKGSIQRKLAMQDGLFFVAEAAAGQAGPGTQSRQAGSSRSDGEIIGTVMAGYDGHRGWLYSLAVDRRHRRQGIGSALVQAAESRLAEMGCMKLNLQVLGNNKEVLGFYRKLNFTVEDRISMGKRLYDTQPENSAAEKPEDER